MPNLQVPACDRCSVGVMDATNPHYLGTCACACHGAGAPFDYTEHTPLLAFTVHGRAQPGGSKRAFRNPTTGRTLVTDANKRAKPWQAEVRSAAHTAMAAEHGHEHYAPLGGSLAVAMTFTVARPLGHYGTRGLRPSAPERPAVRPDVLKLARAVEDALTGIVWRDDAQIVSEHLQKRYGEPERLEVAVWPA